ncbi:MAG: tetratricopeptide repeat protein [Brevinematales bacterium]|nr:tetratricopeptide repeat protein [Brevinematales bacterium]
MEGSLIFFIVLASITVVVVVVILIVRSVTLKYNPVQEIDKSINAGDFKKAQEIAQKELQKAPNSFVLKYYLGQAYEGLQEYSQAASYYEKAAVSATAEGNDEMKPVIFLKVANLYKKKHKYEESIGYYMMVLEKAPQNPKALLEVSEILVETNKTKRAQGFLETLLKIAPNNLKARYLMAQVGFNNQDYNQCTEHLNFLLSHLPPNDPLFPKASLLLADSYLHMKRYEDALPVLEPLIGVPEVSDDSVIKVVEIYLAMNQLDKAVNIMNDSIMTVGEDHKVELYYLIASGHYKFGDINNALKNWKNAIAIDPGYKDLKGIADQFKLHFENPKLENIFTLDHNVFEEFIHRALKLKNIDQTLQKRSYTVFRTHDVDYIIYRAPFAITFHDLADIETNLHNDFMSNLAINIYSLYGFTDEAKGHTVFRKILEVSGEEFIKMINAA